MTGEWSIALKTKKDKIKKENGFPFPDQVEDRFHGNDRGKRGNNRKGSGDDKKKGGGWEGDKLEQLTQSLDKIREKFGSKAVTRASLLK